MKFAVRHFVFGMLISMLFASVASAQYMKITTDNPADNTRMRATGTTVLTITLDTNHDRNGLLQTCNSHTLSCGATAVDKPLDMFSYTLALKAVGGTVTFGTFSAADVNYTDTSPQIQSDIEIEINKSRPTGTFSTPGVNALGTLPVTPVTGAPGIQVQIGASTLNPFGFGTGFGTSCDAFAFGNTYVLGNPADPCGTTGPPGDWFDWDGALSSSGNTPPTISAPATASGVEGSAITPIVATASDAELAQTLTISAGTLPSFLTLTTTPKTSPATGTITGTPGFADAGTYNINWSVSDGTDTGNTTTVLTIANTDRAPTLTQPANMTVNEGSTAEQTITGTDPDGDALSFLIVSGPPFMSVLTDTPTSGTIRLVPSFTTSGTYSATVRAFDGTLFNDKSFSITVNNTNRVPVLAQPNNMTVNAGATADQTITATDPDGDPLSFAKAAGPTYMTVSTTSPGTGSATGNIHLAPGAGDGGTTSATVTASDGSLSDSKSFNITVNGGANQAPTLDPIANMTVTEGATADQVITGSDPDVNPLTFSKASGPTFMTVTTTNATSGNIHLAPGASTAGTYSASASASDGSLSDTKSFTITVNPAVVNNNPPVLTQPANMTVDEGATADQSITATDPDNNPLSFSKVAGPTFMTVTTTSPGTGTGTGNIHLAPGFSDAGTYAATVRADDGNGGTNDKTLTITVNNVNRPPVLNAISPMTVTENATADQTITGTDPDGDALTFSKVTGPTFVTITTSTATSGNVHLAPGIGDAGVYTVQAQVSDGSLTDTEIFQVTVNPFVAGNNPPVLTQPADMTVNEGETADQALTATDPDADVLTFTKVGGPTFMTVGTTGPATGNVHLAPGFADAGTYTGTVQVSDGTLTDQKSFTITVVNVNQAPVADAGGPYTGIVGFAISFNGTGSSDPDGDALTYSWDFDSTDGIQADATGPTPSHTYTVAATYTVTLTVSDGTLSNSDTATATVSASGGFQADASVDGGDRVIRLQANKPFWCVDITPVNDSFLVSDIIPSSVLLSYNGTSIPSVDRRIVAQQDGNNAEICFSKDQLRTLFADLPNGMNEVTLTITGDLQGGGSFVATLDVVVQKVGAPNAVAKHPHGPDAFAWASPNPLNPSTVISFALSQPGSVRLNVYDISGRLVKALANQFMDAGVHDVRWDGTTRTGTRVASGVYFYVLQTPERTVKSQLVVAK